ncbi:MAG: 3-hydroxyacyl-[acyl-carrier-protein] dehydratase FabZ [Verrucomicrobia bacterium]|nr:MAG: 3-hydroxyacyl-[acyl-carrier-protein] dehydratase FabZ [Verrucomicrobiota bacterium]
MQNYPDVKDLLAHRAPFLFVSRIIRVDADAHSIEAEFDIDANLPFFAGHFPGKPIMPGVLMLEAMAQTSGLFLGFSGGGREAEKSRASDEGEGRGRIYYLASSNVKFLKVVNPGSVLVLKSELRREFEGLFNFAVGAFVGGIPVASGTLVLASQKNAE